MVRSINLNNFFLYMFLAVGLRYPRFLKRSVVTIIVNSEYNCAFAVEYASVLFATTLRYTIAYD
jgi:hypothetical protein